VIDLHRVQRACVTECAAIAGPPQRRLALMNRVEGRLIVAMEKQNPKHAARKAAVQ
jgi:hypothetical protein